MNGAASLRSLASRFATRPLRRGLPLLILALAFGAAPLEAKASLLHPANIPVVRAKVQPNGTMEVEITFDILAFVLDQTPQIVLDAPMNGLLDGSVADLQLRLNDAKKRFLEGFAIGDAQHAGVVDSLKFPTAAEIHQVVDGGQTPRLPVMMSAVMKAHLKEGVHSISFSFPEVMGTVVVTTEFPYHEPISDSVDPGNSSAALPVPSQSEVDTLAASMKSKPADVAPTATITESQARKAIQREYNRWSKAYMAHDVPTLLSILEPSYTLKTAQHKLITYPEYEVMLKLRKQKHSDTTRYSTEILRITLKNGVAAIFSRETTTDPGVNQTTGKTEPVSYQHDYIDVWVNRAGRWRLKNTVTQLEQRLPKP